FGSGAATGLTFDLDGRGLVSAYATLQRRFTGAKHFPSSSNSFYELDRFKAFQEQVTFTSKTQMLALGADADDGWFGELFVRVLNMFDVVGSYQRLDKTPNSGILHLYSEIAPEDMPFVVRAGYDKVRIGAEDDIFTLDDRSYLYS